MSSESYHEPQELISEPTRDLHRAMSSLMEELEAVDWYQQRAEATQDAELRAILEHNRDEEIEHAMMVLEWVRRGNKVFDKNIKTYLQKKGPITELEKAAEDGESDERGSRDKETRSSSRRDDGSLGIGSLKGF